MEMEFNERIDICQHDNEYTGTQDEVVKAVKSLNTCKSGDMLNIKGEHFTHCMH